ncbi:MAG: HD domain-containing phosphohydrolase, partial [Candidatus Thiodiazotropha sp.]
RFEVLWRDAEIYYLKQRLSCPEEEEIQRERLLQRQNQLRDDFSFIAECNIGGEFIDDENISRLEALAETTWQRHFDNQLGLSRIESERLGDENEALPVVEKLLADKPWHVIKRDKSLSYPPHLGIKMDVPQHLYNLGELHNLRTSRGTLTPEDRFKINEHIISTIRMLDNLPLPPELEKVPRYASTHHETLDGHGYPRRLTGDELSVPERIMVLADIFEALTAADRPYKPAKPVSVAMDILYKMVQDNHVDRDVFELFLTSGVYRRYAERFLPSEQSDIVDIKRYIRTA